MSLMKTKACSNIRPLRNPHLGNKLSNNTVSFPVYYCCQNWFPENIRPEFLFRVVSLKRDITVIQKPEHCVMSLVGLTMIFFSRIALPYSTCERCDPTIQRNASSCSWSDLKQHMNHHGPQSYLQDIPRANNGQPLTINHDQKL